MGENAAGDVLAPAAGLPFEPGAERLAVAQVIGMARRERKRQRLVAVRDQHAAFRRLLRGMLKRSRLPQRRRSLAQCDQLLSITAGVEPVGDVAALRQTGKLDDTHADGNAAQPRRDLLGALQSGVPFPCRLT
jgi:hypothetical protein